MKEKIYFHNISRTIVSFCVFFLLGRLTGLLLPTGSVAVSTAVISTASELAQFLISSVCAILVFVLFDRLIPPPAEEGEECSGKMGRSAFAGRFRKRTFSLRRYVLTSIPYTIATAALLVVAMYVVAVSFESGVDTMPEENTAVILEFISMIIVHPLLEEYIFRGIFYGELRGMNPIFACLMQAVMFAIAHNGVGGMMYALIGGIILGVSGERSNGIAVPIASHILLNLRTFLYSMVLPPEQHGWIDSMMIGAGLVAALIIFITSKTHKEEPKDKNHSNEGWQEADFED